jgi:hypothetical protein
MSMSRSNDADDTVRRRSGWLILLVVLLVLLVLSGLFLLYYLAPAPPPLFAEQQSPTSSTDAAEIDVGGIKFWIPANYLQYDSARKGGRRHDVSLFAMLPDLTGWSNWNASAFADNGPNSRIVYFTIRDQQVNLTETERLSRIYMASVANPKGEDGPEGLRRYALRDDSGYHGEDLLVGQTPKGPMVLRCVRFGPDVPSPSCLREMPLKGDVGVSYRFKRSRLSHWREIGDAADTLLATLQKPPK